MRAPRTVRTVGIVGLGDQGQPIARNLLRAGWPLLFHARRREVCDLFADLGGIALSPAELAERADLLLLVVVDAGQIEALLLDQGMFAAMRPGSIIAVHSTISPDACRALASKAEARDVHLIDAPVSGGRDRSYAGQLSIFAGGEPGAIHCAEPVFASFARSVVRFGDVGAGQAAKLLNNYFYACHLATADKAIELIDALGIDRQAACSALPSGSGASAAFAMQAARGFERTRHDKGTAHAVKLLSSVVEELRALAGAAGVELGLVDRLAELGLEGERRRAALEEA